MRRDIPLREQGDLLQQFCGELLESVEHYEESIGRNNITDDRARDILDFRSIVGEYRDSDVTAVSLADQSQDLKMRIITRTREMTTGWWFIRTGNSRLKKKIKLVLHCAEFDVVNFLREENQLLREHYHEAISDAGTSASSEAIAEVLYEKDLQIARLQDDVRATNESLTQAHETINYLTTEIVALKELVMGLTNSALRATDDADSAPTSEAARIGLFS